MKYYSTRDRALRYDAAEAIKMGLSRDGGLLTPCEIPQIDESFLKDLVGMRYQERAAKVMALYLTDYSEEELLAFMETLDKFIGFAASAYLEHGRVIQDSQQVKK